MNKILTLTITLAVSVILVGSLLAPVLSDATKSMEAVDTEQSNVQNRMSKVDSFTLEWDASDKTISLNGTVLTDLTVKTMLLVSDKVMIRVTNISSIPSMGIWFEGLQSGSISNNSYDISVSLSEGTITFIYGSGPTTDTIGVSYAYVYDPNGEYAALQEGYLTSAKVNTGDTLVTYQMGGWWDTSYTPTVVTSTSGEIVTTTNLYASNATTGTETTLTLTFDTESFDELTLVSSDPQLSSAIVPYKYTAYGSNEYSELLSPIILLVIVAILIVAVGALSLRRE